MKQEEHQGQKESHRRVVHLQPLADRGDKVSHQRLHDAEHPQGEIGERVLRQADSHLKSTPAIGDRYISEKYTVTSSGISR